MDFSQLSGAVERKFLAVLTNSTLVAIAVEVNSDFIALTIATAVSK
ncbi:MAG: hypothetical protein ACKOQS_02375 [Dolichospermum sp.]